MQLSNRSRVVAITPNVLRLCDGWEFEIQLLNYLQSQIEKQKIRIYSSTQLLQNTLLAVVYWVSKLKIWEQK